MQDPRTIDPGTHPVQPVEYRDESFDPYEMTRSPRGFDYTGLDSLGAAVKGYTQTTELDLAQMELERAGIRVTSIYPRRILRQKTRRPSLMEFASLAEQFGDLMEVGENPVQVCRLLSFTQTNRYLAEALTNCGERIMNGWTLSEAFSAQKDKNGEPLFPVTFICALRIGEEVGTAKDQESGVSQSAFLLTLKRFAETQKKADAIRSSIRSALMYPIAVIAFCFVATGVVLYFVMPRMVDLYSSLLTTSQDKTLPLPTRILIGASDFMLSWWGVALLLVLAGVAVYFIRFVQTPHGSDTIKLMALRMPLFGEFFRDYFAAQTLRNLALLASGIPSMNERLAIAADTSTNPAYQEMLLHVRHRLMVESTDLKKLFKPYPFLMGKEFEGVLMTFEKTADMQGTFHNYARVVETRAERKLEKVLFWLQNFSIVPVGIFVAFVLIALYSPMFELAGRLGQ